MRRPLYVVVEETSAGGWIATSYDLELAGEGESQFEALDSLRDQVTELFQTLTELDGELVPHLVGKLRLLQSLAE